MIVTATSDVCGPLTIKIAAWIPDLVGIGSGRGFTLTGALPQHPSNHFGLPEVNGRLVQLADYYATDPTREILAYNDMSLVWGGLFDIGPTPDFPNGLFWQPPHDEHRVGRQIDVGIPSALRDQARFRGLAHRFGFRVEEEVTPPHYHLTFRGRGRR